MLSPSSVNAELLELVESLERWRDHPADFVREVINATPDPWQECALYDLRHYGRVSIAACHGPGKDALAAWAILWCMLCWEHPKIPCTAPTSHQLRDLLWSEVAKWRRGMLPYFANLLEVKSDRIEFRSEAETWFAAARTARKENPEGLQGFHADVVLVVVDEASGVPLVSFEVLDGAMTGPTCFMLLIGNPTQLSGYFYDSHHSDRSRWRTYRVMATSAHDGGALPPGVFTSDRVSADYVGQIFRKYGKDSNVARVRVYGLFPRSEANQVIPLEWVEARRAVPVPAGLKVRHHVVVGVDVARFGEDDSALCARQGPVILDLDDWHGHDERATAGKVLAACRRYVARGLTVGAIYVDAAGVGAGVVKLLRPNAWLRENKILLVGVQVGVASHDPECARLRDALWWRGRKVFDPSGGGDRLGRLPMFAEGVRPEKITRLADELSSPRFDYNDAQLVKVESKDDMRDRQLGSPDLADAFLITLYRESGMPEPKPEAYRQAQAKPVSRFAK